MSSSTKLSNWNISTVVGDTPTDIVIAKQVHGNVLVPVSDCENGVTVADGLIGTKGDTTFGIRTADCMPLVLGTNEHVYGLHISRKTLIAGILEELTKQLGTEKITGAYIGPHICENCFTFSYKGEEILLFEKMFPYATEMRTSVTHLSLLRVIAAFLEENGVEKENIITDKRCTFESKELPSYKRWLTTEQTSQLLQITTTIQSL